ncbi:hypothetical protein INT45_004809 [Circinella minor]|uniref:Uncharacterized protein n=1 Tax=Circinella minor TaxID=1195481 RepID=A0A8H7RV34_9FUNG|nr:hypothetical protein INT45_004809 [Circinella minor]
MHFTTTFTSIAACALFIGATLTSFTIAIDQQQTSSNSLAYSAPKQNMIIARRSLFTNQRIERRHHLRMIKRKQEEPEEEDEEENDEGHSSDRTSQSSGNRTKNGSGNNGKFIEQTADPTVHAVTKTGDNVLGVSHSENPLSSAGKFLSGGGSSASGSGQDGKEEEEERGSEA